jgi:hypothetical protein
MSRKQDLLLDLRFAPRNIVRVGGPGPQSSRLSLYQGAETTEKVVLCYFANWAGIREGDGLFVPENIQVKKDWLTLK